MRARLLLALLLLPTPALGAITNVGSLGADGSSVSGTTIVITMDAALDQHNVALVRIGVDNFGTVTGFTNEVLSIADTGGNTYEKLCEYSYTDGGVQAAGATISLWVGRAATALAISDTITVTLANAVTARVAQAQELNVTDGNTLRMAGTCKTEDLNGADAGSLVTDTLSSKEYYFVRALAWESATAAITAETATWAAVTGVSIDGGTGATSMTTDAERLIATTTSATSDPLLSAMSGRDGASILVALEECTVPCTSAAPAARRIITVE